MDWELGEWEWEFGLKTRGMGVGSWDLGGENRGLRWELWGWEQQLGSGSRYVSQGEPRVLE